MEEWNEYGELKEHVNRGAVAPAVATPSSTPSTPSKTVPSTETTSKVRFTAETPTKASQSAATGNPLTVAMRQAGAEAAKKASDTKSKERAKILGVLQPSTSTEKKVDDPTASGLPLSSGTTETASVIASETGSTNTKSTADDIKTPEPLTKLRQDSRSSDKGGSGSSGIVHEGSQVLPEVNESSEQRGSADTPADQGLGGENSDSKIKPVEVSDKGKQEVEEQEIIKAGEKIAGESNPGS